MEEKELEQFFINEEKRTIKDLLYLCNLLGIHTINTHVAENIILCKVSLKDLHKARVKLLKDFVNCLCAYDVDDIDTMLKVKFIMEDILYDVDDSDTVNKVKYIMEDMLGGVDDDEKLS